MGNEITIKVDGWELVQPEGASEPLIRDTELGRRAGLANPRHIRGHIEGLINDGAEGFEGLRRYESRNQRGGVAGVVTGYDLTEDQALMVLLEMRTPAALKIRREVARVYMAVRRGQLVAPHGDVAALRAEVGEALAIVRQASANPERFIGPGRVGDSSEVTRSARSALKTLAKNRGWSFNRAHGWLRVAFKVPSYKLVSLQLFDLMMTLIRCADERFFQAEPLGPVRLITEHEQRQIELFQAKSRKRLNNGSKS